MDKVVKLRNRLYVIMLLVWKPIDQPAIETLLFALYASLNSQSM